MIPHERSLVHRLETKPFALLGINSDDAAAYRNAVKQESITWPSWWDGGSTSGPIASRWNVRGWPTTYVLDVKGVIRYRDVREADMDAAVDTLLKEAGNPTPPRS